MSRTDTPAIPQLGWWSAVGVCSLRKANLTIRFFSAFVSMCTDGDPECFRREAGRRSLGDRSRETPRLTAML